MNVIGSRHYFGITNAWSAVDCNPVSGIVADVDSIRRTWPVYHLAVRRVKRNETDIGNERFA